MDAASLGAIDVVLVSNDEHPDNFDAEGRRIALGAPLLLTHPGAARRLGPPAVGLEPWEPVDVPGGNGLGVVTAQAVPRGTRSRRREPR